MSFGNFSAEVASWHLLRIIVLRRGVEIEFSSGTNYEIHIGSRAAKIIGTWKLLAENVQLCQTMFQQKFSYTNRS